MGGLLLPLLDPFEFTYAGTQRWVRGAAFELATRHVMVTTLAIEHYRRAHGGNAPPSLDALVPVFLPAAPSDPFTGGPIEYRSDGGGYTVYCLDGNLKDDGGIIYGFGAAPAHYVGPQSPRDYGIRVPLRPAA
jgi:hypothetical protein